MCPICSLLSLVVVMFTMVLALFFARAKDLSIGNWKSWPSAIGALSQPSLATNLPNLRWNVPLSALMMSFPFIALGGRRQAAMNLGVTAAISAETMPFAALPLVVCRPQHNMTIPQLNAFLRERALHPDIGRMDVRFSCIWRLDCNVHGRMLSKEAVQRNPSALDCIYCHTASLGWRVPSTLEELLGGIVLDACHDLDKEVRPEGGEGCLTLLTDSKVLEPKKRFGSVDFWFPTLALGIAADGEHHFPEKEQQVRRGKDADGRPRRPQWQIDNEFNEAALQQMLSLLRVKFNEDAAVMKAHVLKAIQDRMGASSDSKAFVRFTPGFGREDL